MSEGQEPFETDKDGMTCWFCYMETKDDAASQVAGHVIYKMEPFAKLRSARDPLSEQHERVNEEHKARFPRAWAAFQAGKHGPADGTPIQQYPLLDRAQVATLRGMGIFTVEMLASVADSRLSMAVTREMRDRARQYLQGASETERELRRTNAELEGQVKDLAIRVAQLQAAVEASKGDGDEAEKPKRGRPRKAA